MIENFDYKKLAKELFDDIQKQEVKNTPNLRNIRKIYSKKLENGAPEQILNFARYFIKNFNYRWIAFELIRYHKTAIKLIGVKELEEFGKEINSWGAVDIFAVFLAGPAWQYGQVSDELINKWAHSEDRWWRRTALVCTVPLNRRSMGGTGDTIRTLNVCRLLANDKDDMVVKAMSWALRELIPHDVNAVREFIRKHEDVLASRVKREVNNKLRTGLKNPKREAN
jgi:3-methyladenine DNA glycosylase AlkD